MQITDFTNEKIFDLTQTIAADLFTQTTYAWEVLPLISDYIRKIGPTLPRDIFEQRGEDIWVAKSAKIFDSAYIGGPCILDEDATIRQCAFIRGSAIVGKGATVGNSTELKNVVLFPVESSQQRPGLPACGWDVSCFCFQIKHSAPPRIWRCTRQPYPRRLPLCG